MGQTVVIDCEPHNELKGKVCETFDHAGFVNVRYPNTLAICWPPGLRILDPMPGKKPSLKSRMLKRRRQ